MWVRLPPAVPAISLQPSCRAEPPEPVACADDQALGSDYAYLLGLYLGDGTLSQFPRGVWRLRICMDAKYLGIRARCRAAISSVADRRSGETQNPGYVEIHSSWKHWICLFPQHGPGRKHHRSIELEEWQSDLVQRHPRAFLTGLIHSDGCRAINKVKILRKGEVKRYEYPRYFFSNRSADIRGLFMWACGLIGVESRQNNAYNISVAQRASVAILDSFIGPKR
jgi:hypothetical protein